MIQTSVLLISVYSLLIRGVLGGIVASKIAPEGSSTTDVPSAFSGANSVNYAYSQGIATVYYEYGDSQNPTVIMTGGWPNSANIYNGFANELAAKGLHVVVYDKRGFGQSDKPWGPWAYSLPNLADEMGAVIDAAAPNKKVAVFGDTWSPFAASEYCAMYPNNDKIGAILSIGVPSIDLSNQDLIDQTRNLVNDQQNLTRVLSSWASIAYQFGISVPVIPEAIEESGVASWIADDIQKVLNAANTSDQAVLSEILGPNLADGIMGILSLNRDDTSHGMQIYQWYVTNRLIPGIISGKMYRQYLPVEKVKVFELLGDTIENTLEIKTLSQRTPNLNLTYLNGTHFSFDSPENHQYMMETLLEWVPNL